MLLIVFNVLSLNLTRSNVLCFVFSLKGFVECFLIFSVFSVLLFVFQQSTSQLKRKHRRFFYAIQHTFSYKLSRLQSKTIQHPCPHIILCPHLRHKNCHKTVVLSLPPHWSLLSDRKWQRVASCPSSMPKDNDVDSKKGTTFNEIFKRL